MNLDKYTYIYLVGVGGVGMSALARFFLQKGCLVFGYDMCRSDMCMQLEKEGVNIHYDEDIKFIPDGIKTTDANKILVIYTAAVSLENKEIIFLKDKGCDIYKRSEIVGLISKSYFTIAVAGTHGKTTTTAILTHILKKSGKKIISFIGGITNNYNSNIILDKEADIFIIEADEYDYSFLELYPDIAIITSVDSDHLDVYKTEEELHKSFLQFSKQVKDKGLLLIESSLNLKFPTPKNGIKKKYSAIEKTDYYANNINICDSKVFANLFTLDKATLQSICIAHRVDFSLPGIHNISNMMAAVAVSDFLGVPYENICSAVKTFSGIRRRFEILINKNQLTFIDDYAHHPAEIFSTINTVRTLFPKRILTVVFQPHLFSRTKDFADDFAISLSLADSLILLDIFPAREDPIVGVDSKMLLDLCTNRKKELCVKEDLLCLLEKKDIDILLTLGAGDIGRLTEPIKYLLN